MAPVVFINCSRFPFVDQIMSGMKLYETRTRDTLHRFLGDRILIAETGHGKPIIRAVATVHCIITVYTRSQWEVYREDACIPLGSSYDWHDGTRKKVLYELTDVKPVAPFRLPDDSYRHGRVWAELAGKFPC